MAKVLMIGFGSVARELAKMVGENRQRLQSYGFEFVPIGIFTKSRGNLVDEKGIDLRRALADVTEKGRFAPPSAGMTPLEACRVLDYDVLVELSPLSIEGRGEPAISHIRAALERGCSAVTANKGPVAFSYPNLAALAERNGARFLFESTVMDGSPVFNMVARCMKGSQITGFSGVLNSTTNYILGRMEEGATLQEATREAIEAGTAEADPSNDIDGWDAATKVSALARVLMDADITPLEVERSGIRHVTNRMIEEAKSRGKRLKLICRATRESSSVRASVGLEEFDERHIVGSLSAFDSALCLESDVMVPNYIVQKSSTPRDTAFGVLEDLLSIFCDRA